VKFAPRTELAALIVAALTGLGCNEATTTTATSVNQTPANVLQPSAPDEAKPAPTSAPAPAPATAPAPPVASSEPAPAPTAPAATSTPSPADKGAASTPAPADKAAQDPPATAEASTPTAATDVALLPIKYDELMKRLGAEKDVKLTMVDTWATWCGPCKENFPHVVQMNEKYGKSGLKVVSLSFDNATDDKARAEALKFLKEKNAVFRNYLLDEDSIEADFEKFNILSIPAVFLYGPDGKEMKRFTGDDPNHQFTYDQVEKTVAAILEGKPVPEEPKAAKP
jgi:thiol-disulfide isomerase/thioredoxin